MPRQGWIKLHRSLLDNPMWLQKPFSEGQAWVDLLMLAETEEKDFVVNGCTVHQKPGEVRTSKKYLMERWGWTRRKIDGVFYSWEHDHKIVHKNVHKAGSVLTIVKWGFFQVGSSDGVHINEHKSVHHLKKTKKFSVVGGASETPSSDTGRNPDDYEMVQDENGRWIARRKR